MKNKKIILKKFDSTKTYPDGKYIVKTSVVDEEPMLCNHINLTYKDMSLWATEDGFFVKPEYLCRINIVFDNE